MAREPVKVPDAQLVEGASLGELEEPLEVGPVGKVRRPGEARGAVVDALDEPAGPGGREPIEGPPLVLGRRPLCLVDG